MGLILLIIIILLLVGGLPTWRHSRNWGYGPSGVLRIDSDYPARPRCNGTNPARLLVLCGTLCIPLGFASEPMREGKPGLAYGLIPADVELLNAVIVGVDDV